MDLYALEKNRDTCKIYSKLDSLPIQDNITIKYMVPHFAIFESLFEKCVFGKHINRQQNVAIFSHFLPVKLQHWPQLAKCATLPHVRPSRTPPSLHCTKIKDPIDR